MKTKLILPTLILIVLLQIGCARQGGATSEAGVCPEPAPETALLKNDKLGYCFLYPDDYIVESRDNGDIVVIDSVMNHVDPRFDIIMEDASGRTVAEVADTQTSGTPPGMETERSTNTLGGEEAMVVDNVPGQEISRLVFVAQGDRIYRLAFTHTSPDLGEAYTRAENLYTVVSNSFRFLSEQ